MQYRLVLVDNESGKDRQSWTLQLPATIGRDPQLDVCIDDESISRTHCRLSLNTYDALSIRDLGSTNGTYVHNERVNQSTLQPGDILQLGAVTLRIEFTSDTDPGRPVAKKSPHLSSTQPILSEQVKRSLGRPAQPEKKWWQFWRD